MIQFGLILVLRSLELGINEAAVIPTPGHKEWLLLGPLSYCIPPSGAKVPTTKGPGGEMSGGEMSPQLLYSRADQHAEDQTHGCSMSTRCSPPSSRAPASCQSWCGYGVGVGTHGHLQLAGEPRDLMVQGLTIRFRF